MAKSAGDVNHERGTKSFELLRLLFTSVLLLNRRSSNQSHNEGKKAVEAEKGFVRAPQDV